MVQWSTPLPSPRIVGWPDWRQAEGKGVARQHDPAKHGTQSRIDREHQELAELIGEVRAVCPRHGGDADCGQCAPDLHRGCMSALVGIGERLMGFAIDHFRTEEEMMAKLPSTAPVRRHCAAHRDSHAQFVALYNGKIRGLSSDDAASGALRLESALEHWAREHALKFDDELATLIAAQRERA